MQYVTTTKPINEIAITRKHSSKLDIISSYVIRKLEKQRRRLVNWSDYILCITNSDTGDKVYIAEI